MKNAYNEVSDKNKILKIEYKNCLDKYDIKIENINDKENIKEKYLKAFEINKNKEIEKRNKYYRCTS